MSLRPADPRFLLPAAPETAVVLGGMQGWRAALEQAGVGEPVDGPPDLAVAPGASVHEARATGAAMLILMGRVSRRRLRHAGFAVQRYLPLPGPDRPAVLLPLDQPTAACYAIDHWTVAPRAWKRLRNATLEVILRARLFPSGRSVLTLASRTPGPPFLASGAPLEQEPAAWFAVFEGHDDYSRGVLLLFPRGARSPAWVVKFSRLAGGEDAFRRDERGLLLARDAGDVVARHAPRLLGRFSAGGVPASCETAAGGLRLGSILSIPRHRSTARTAIDRVAGWIVDMAVATADPPERLDEERRRLENEVLPRWPGAPGDLVAGVPPVPAVLQHNDLGSWNIMWGDDDFVAVDWESSRRHGFPLWDLLYFLTDALTLRHGGTNRERTEAAVRMFRGEHQESALLFGWVRRAAEASGVPDEAVGAVALLGWLHHGLSHLARAVPPAGLSPTEALAERWLADPGLGVGWRPR